MIFSIHARKRKKERNYIAHLQAHKQLVLITYVKTNNDIANLKPTNGFFNSKRRRKEMILHVCNVKSGFFYSHR